MPKLRRQEILATKELHPGIEEGLVVNALYLEQFWRFVAERQAIYWKRKAGKLPPWTEDPVLRDYFFTHPYRELDAGTQYYIDHIGALMYPRDIVFNTLAYRYFNNEPTWDFLLEYFNSDHIPFGSWKHKEVAFALTQWEAKGHQVFTSAFTVTGVRFGGYPDKISNVCWLVEYFQDKAKQVAKEVLDAENLKDIFRAILNLQGMGAFLAYEVTIDLNYTWITREAVTEDDFVNPGPGCRRGLNYIFPKSTNYVQLITALRKYQDRYFSSYGLRFKRYAGRDLTLRNVEHSLCEFSKYARTKYGVTPDGTVTGSTTRRYVPKLQAKLV